MESYLATLTSTIPVTRIRETVRYVRLDHCSELTQCFFEFAFPRFFSPDDFGSIKERWLSAQGDAPSGQQVDDNDRGNGAGKHNQHLIAQADGVLRELHNQMPHVPMFLAAKMRRYSGDLYPYLTDDPNGLPRGRYYAVASRSGSDLGLLRHEILAYSNFDKTGDFLILDGLLPSEPLTKQFLGEGQFPEGQSDIMMFLLAPGTKAYLGFVGFLDAKQDRLTSRTLKELEVLHQGDIDFAVIRVNTRSSNVEINSCLDLRLHKSRQWLFDTFHDGCPNITGLKQRVHPDHMHYNFANMVPALFSSNLGGSSLSQFIGVLLRRIGVEALIYPSARHPLVKAHGKNGETIDSSGWNLVDYRGTSTPKLFHEAGIIIVQAAKVYGFDERDDLKPGDLAKKIDAFKAANIEPTVMAHVDSIWHPPDGAYAGRTLMGAGALRDCILFAARKEILETMDHTTENVFHSRTIYCWRGSITDRDLW